MLMFDSQTALQVLNTAPLNRWDILLLYCLFVKKFSLAQIAERALLPVTVVQNDIDALTTKISMTELVINGAG